jgi:KDO2-lipid IV(A) lauroyltransferase
MSVTEGCATLDARRAEGGTKLPIDFDTVANSELALKLAIGVGRTTPPSVGGRLADTAADAIAALRSSTITRAVRSNQWVVSGGSLHGTRLDAQVRATLRHMARCLYDLYHVIEDPDAMLELVSISAIAADWLEHSKSEPVVFAAPHLSNFDLGGRALALHGLRAQVLSVPAPTDAYLAQNEMRRAVGLDVTPISVASMRQAVRRLAEGGTVLTGVDRPTPNGQREMRFFGRPARLPYVHIRLAERSGAPLFAIWVQARAGGGYLIDGTPVPLAEVTGPETTGENARRVLAVIEDVISEHPEQWAMPHAVWPEALVELETLETTE